MIALSRIDLSEIVFAHLRTLRKFGQKNINVGDVFFFFGLPALVALPLAYLFPDRLYDQASKLLTAVSLMGGFLFNLLARTSQIVEKAKKDSALGSVRRVFAKEIHSNVAFGIVLSLFCDVVLIIFSFMTKPVSCTLQIHFAVSWLGYFFIISFLLTLLMIVKRMFIILSSDVEDM